MREIILIAIGIIVIVGVVYYILTAGKRGAKPSEEKQEEETEESSSIEEIPVESPSVESPSEITPDERPSEDSTD